jgi:conjugative transfer signal peptidase TraF
MRRDALAKRALMFWALAIGWAAFAFLFTRAGFRINETSSAPIGLWRVAPVAGPLTRGAYVSFCPPDTPIFRLAQERGYLAKGACASGFQPLLKPVAAIAGDRIVLDEKGLWVNGELISNSRAEDQDRLGRPLPTLSFRSAIVPRGEVWLLSSFHASSFDSRYFGPVNVVGIEEIATPMWVSSGS